MLKSAFASLTLASALAITSNAYAADLIIDEPVMAGVVDVSGSWDGPFIGVFGGYGWADYSDSVDYEFPMDGWLVGAAVGANFTVTDGIIAGVVGDIAWSDISGLDDPGAGDYIASIDWAASLRGRIGFDGGAFMPYLTGGLAVAGVSVDETDAGNGTDNATHVGWTAGAGVEIAATDSLSIDLLYRYSDYGTQTYNVDVDEYDASISAHQFTIGLNLAF